MTSIIMVICGIWIAGSIISTIRAHRAHAATTYRGQQLFALRQFPEDPQTRGNHRPEDDACPSHADSKTESSTGSRSTVRSLDDQRDSHLPSFTSRSRNSQQTTTASPSPKKQPDSASPDRPTSNTSPEHGPDTQNVHALHPRSTTYLTSTTPPCAANEPDAGQLDWENRLTEVSERMMDARCAVINHTGSSLELARLEQTWRDTFDEHDDIARERLSEDAMDLLRPIIVMNEHIEWQAWPELQDRAQGNEHGQ